VALLVPGPPRAAPPAGRGFTGVQARAGVLGAVAGGFGGTVPEVTAAAEETERKHGEAQAGEARAA
jgi:hypothetical protein